MNLLLFEPDEPAATGVAVSGRRARHLIEVLGVKAGDLVRAGVIGGPVGTAEVGDIGSERVELRFVARAAAPAPLPIDLIIAMPRPKVLSRVLEVAAAMRVRSIRITRSWRVDKAYLDSPRLESPAIATALRLGAEQGASTHLPPVVIHPRFREMIEVVVAEAAATRRIVAHAGTGSPIEQVATPGWTGQAALAIGPEGGWIERELASFATAGFVVARLGDAILRVEAAVAAAIAQLELLARLPAPRALGDPSA